ncbi:hypothetical protein NAC44_01880 [Allorhizobium sp. BGMRC 0089]|uniref:hypothetical protein n=1 Tax=Allorhizobium sonneratiae TaxID=2934936 RepID=UPI002034983A|nr:hypothetical protein [Allorhizobium sonneratiae]MCM2291077.1 hypothetical protein [Allorhizobium sonneratiae]
MTFLKRLHHRITGLLLTAAAFLFCFAVTAFAATNEASAPTSFLSAILPPILDLAVTVLASGGAWLAARLVRLTGVDTEARRLEVEGKLREALHSAAENGLRFALTKAGMPTIAEPTADIIADALFYVTDKNPDTIRKLGVSGNILEDIIRAKWPIASLGLPLAASLSTNPAT